MAEPDPWMLANVTTDDDYEPDNEIADGPSVDVVSLAVTNAAIYYQLQRDGTWLPEVFLGPWVGSLAEPDTTGFRCRSAVSGHPAQVSARLVTNGAADTGSVPSYTIAANGVVGAAVITGIVASNGTKRAGSGYSVSRSQTGTYVIEFDNPLQAAPVVLAAPIGSDITVAVVQVEPTADGFTVALEETTGSLINADFNFAVFPVE